MEKKKLKELIRILRKKYPKSRTALTFKTPLQILVSTMLSAQCTDERVNKITPYLYKKYKSVKDFARARQPVLEKEIRSTGFYKNKAKNIIAASKKIVNDFGGKVPDKMEELLKLPGVARKTANIVLYNAYGKSEGIAVDTHVRRLSQRLGLSGNKDPNKIEQDLMKLVPIEKWGRITNLLIDHGRAICTARKPECQTCFLNDICPSAFKV